MNDWMILAVFVLATIAAVWALPRLMVWAFDINFSRRGRWLKREMERIDREVLEDTSDEDAAGGARSN